MSTPDVKVPDVSVRLSGMEGNVFAIISRVRGALHRAGYEQEAREYAQQAMACKSYDAVLQLTMATVVTA